MLLGGVQVALVILAGNSIINTPHAIAFIPAAQG